MTVAAAFWSRKYPELPPAVPRLFEVEPGSRILGQCHWQSVPDRHPTLVLVHGLEGSAESGYMLGLADRAFAAGFNAIRLNQRNCGGTADLTPALYNSGLSGDFRAVLIELTEGDRLPEIFFAGYSMGGNLVLKMAGELGAGAPEGLRGICAVCAALDLSSCVNATDGFRNILYRRYFVRKLKRRFLAKRALFPDRYADPGLERVHTIRDFDDIVTAPNCGYLDAADYYHRASAMRTIAEIRVPTLLLSAEDDPMVPPRTFADPAIHGNPNLSVVISKHGGHCAFLSGDAAERHWAEARVVEFCAERSKLLSPSGPDSGSADRKAKEF
ncbi:MAG TPA: alpha/beta fold hydrolase [Candidatus Acidoferrales bacterium]|nr:alpha/beta fold hydrolase [Candidatus Acidoferrales bacterium]